jgi:hypothetical protein
MFNNVEEHVICLTTEEGGTKHAVICHKKRSIMTSIQNTISQQ